MKPLPINLGLLVEKMRLLCACEDCAILPMADTFLTMLQPHQHRCRRKQPPQHLVKSTESNWETCQVAKILWPVPSQNWRLLEELEDKNRADATKKTVQEEIKGGCVQN